MAFVRPQINTVPEYQSSLVSPTGAEGLSLIGRPHVLVVGASGRFIARSALRARCCVSVVDLFGDADTAAICDQSFPFATSGQHPMAVRCESLQEFALRLQCLQRLQRLRLVRKESPEAGVDSNSLEKMLAGPTVVVFAGGVENCPELFDPILYPDAVVAGPESASIRKLLDLNSVIACCSRYDIAMPAMVTSSRQAAIEGDGQMVWLKKQIRSGGGLQVKRWDSTSAVDFNSGFYLQQKLDGVTVSGCYVAAAQGGTTASHMLGACAGHDRQTETDYRYTGSYGPISVEPKRLREMERVGSVIAEYFKLSGVFGIDFIDSPQGLKLIDINPRITASAEILERSFRTSDSEFSILETHLSACLGSELPSQIKCLRDDVEQGSGQARGGRWFSKRIVYFWGREPITISRTVQNRLLAHECFTDIPSVGTIVDPNAPLVSVHSQSSDQFAMEAKTMAALKLLAEIVGVSLL